MLRDWLSYRAVPADYWRLRKFVYQVIRFRLRDLCRRWKMDRLGGMPLERICGRLWPSVRTVHPWSAERFTGNTGGRVRMR